MMAEEIEPGVSLLKAQRFILAAVSGKSSGAGTETLRFRDSTDTVDRITATVDGQGNRTNVVLNGD